jgi:nicotinate phosphoribosyltransferase
MEQKILTHEENLKIDTSEEMFISNKDLPLYIPQRCILTTAAHIAEGMHEREATFDLYIRELPKNRNYLVFVGLEDVIKYLLNLKFSEDDVQWLKRQFRLSEDVLNYFRNFKFTGSVYAMKEETMCFPNQPLIRITAPIGQLQIIESFLFNTVGFQTMIASKISRIVHAAKPAAAGVGENRAHGLEAGLKAIRAGYIVGTSSSPLMLSFKRYGLPAVGGIATHFFVTSFPTEIEAFRSYLKTDHNGSVMVDTYNFEKGLQNIAKVAKELEKEGRRLKWISIDSGDLVERWKKARKFFDENGLSYVGITAISNLDEYKIKELIEKGTNYQFYGAATEVVTSSDCPKIEIVYKLAEIKEGNEWKPKAKFSPGKISYGGRKQVFRQSFNEKFIRDIIGLEGEDIKGERLLEPFIIEGKLMHNLPELKEIRMHTLGQYEKFDEKLFDISKNVSYSVSISEGVNLIMKKIMEEMLR